MKVNIIFYLSAFGLGGAGNSIFKLCKKLPKNKFNISIICLNKCYYKANFEKLNIKVFEIKSKRSIYAFKKIKEIVKKLISNNYKSNIFVSNIYYSNILSILFLKKLNIKIVLIERTPYQELSIYYNFSDFIKKNIIKFLIGITFKKADCCVSNSKYISKKFNQRYNLNFKTIYPPSFDNRVYSKKTFILNSKFIHIGTACRLTKEKGLENFIKIIPKLKKNIIFKVIGDGPELNNLQNISKNLGIKNRVKFLGKQKPNKIKSIIKKFDLYINCSDFEGFPNSVVEAISVGVPVVASQSHGGINEILNNKKFGLIYKNEAELIYILNSILKKKIKFNLTKYKIYKHLKNFSEKNNVKKYNKLFEKI